MVWSSNTIRNYRKLLSKKFNTLRKFKIIPKDIKFSSRNTIDFINKSKEIIDDLDRHKELVRELEKEDFLQPILDVYAKVIS